jgi:hypothetical protein
MTIEEQKMKIFLKRLKQDVGSHKGAKMGVKEFTDSMPVKRAQFYRWIKGEQIMTVKKYYKALDILDIKESELFQEVTA